MAKKERIELCVKTNFDINNSIIKVRDLFYKALELDMPGIAVTDRSVNSFAEVAKIVNDLFRYNDKEFKVLYGFTTYIVDDLNCINPPENLTEIQHLDEYRSTIILKKQEGLRDFYYLKSLAGSDKYSCHVRMSDIMKYRDELILGFNIEELFFYYNKDDSYCLENRDYCFKFLKNYDYMEVETPINILADYDHIYGDLNLKKIEKMITEMVTDFDKNGIMSIATSRPRYLNKGDLEAYRVIDHIRNKRKVKRYLLSTDEMLGEFAFLGKKKAQEIVIDNTNKIFESIEYINPINTNKCWPAVKNADKYIKDSCINRAKEIYGNKLPQIVKERIDKELGGIIQNGYSSYFIIIKRMVDEAKKDGYHLHIRGRAGAFLTTYLLGICEANPLPPHYYCPKCHHIEFEGEWLKKINVGDSGIDLPNKKCPECKHSLIKDGYNIPAEAFMGIDFSKEPNIDISLPLEYQEHMIKFLENMDEIGGLFYTREG